MYIKVLCSYLVGLIGLIASACQVLMLAKARFTLLHQTILSSFVSADNINLKYKSKTLLNRILVYTTCN